MSWITPKVNWTSDDYYNLEDAQRIAGNICHLGDMADQIYGDKYIYYALVYRMKKYKQYYPDPPYYETVFGRITSFWRWTNPSNYTVVQPEQYTRSLVDWLDKDTVNLTALTKFLLLSSMPDQVQITTDMKYTCVDTDQVSGGVYFDDECIHNYNGVQTNTYSTPLASIWENASIRLPLSSQWYTDDPKRYYINMSTDYSVLRNKKFWSASELNIIESKIQLVYDRFTSYLGG